jgi:hypothetical protein
MRTVDLKSSSTGKTMTEYPPNGFAQPTRRSIVRAVLGAAGAAAAIVPRSAAAEPTISKDAVAYQDQPQGDRECDKCVQFEPPNGCKVVIGTISPHGSCRIFRAS